ncbi:MAG TPA: zf-HC2 domain-containing protein [Streptosporangiaceae bacterium]|nr:zf-HC2 domain-containing protein [Streptosporangiaceae bacterium]
MDDTGTCAGIRPQLGVYLTGAITPADRAVVVRHLTACADCRAELAGLAGLPGLLRRPPVQAAAQAFGEDDAGVGDAGAGAGEPSAGEPSAGEPSAGEPSAGEPSAAGSADAVPRRLVRRAARRRRRRWQLAAAAFVLVIGTGWALHQSDPPATGPQGDATVLQTRAIGHVTVLTDDEGYTLYWFGPDSATKSACQGGCARNWPPVTGPATWGPAVTGTIGAIVRPGGSLQATYDGHPLYATTADTGPGQTRGNGVWSHGGEWHEVTVPGRGS